MIRDLFQAGVGSVAVDDIALTVPATVIGHQRAKGWIVTDAGWVRQALGNVMTVLAEAGCGAEQVLRVTAYIVGVENWPAFKPGLC